MKIKYKWKIIIFIIMKWLIMFLVSKINDFIIFKYNDTIFVNYINFKIKKKYLNEIWISNDYEPKYFIIDNNKDLIGFNSKIYYFL